MSDEPRLICKGCGEPLGHSHNEECPVAQGAVVASQAVEVDKQPRCRSCHQRIGTVHLPRCDYVRVRGGTPIVTEEECDPMPGDYFDTARASGKADYQENLAERAAKAVSDLQSDGFPDVLVVQMHPESATTPEAVMECVEDELAEEAQVVIGVWRSGHVVVGKNDHGGKGTSVPVIEGKKALGQPKEWPRKLIWGYFTTPSGVSGPITHISDVEKVKEGYPGTEVEPYIPVRNLRAALLDKAMDAEAQAAKGGIPNRIEALEARSFAFRDAIDLLDRETWTEGE